jgi:hypothetical protein
MMMVIFPIFLCFMIPFLIHRYTVMVLSPLSWANSETVYSDMGFSIGQS